MTGTLYGIGVGPGNPDLITMEARKVITRCNLILVPGKSPAESRAYHILHEALQQEDLAGKRVLCCDFPMTRDPHTRALAVREIYERIRGFLLDGTSVACLTIGDPLIYSTFAYLQEAAAHDQLPVKIINGIPSFLASAACFNLPLCLGEEELHILNGDSDFAEGLRLSGTKVFMKLGRRLPELVSALKTYKGTHSLSVYAVKDCGLPTEESFAGLHALEALCEDHGHPYMMTIIVKDVLS